MKRDMNLVHKLLLFVQDKGSRLFSGPIQIEGYERDQVIHHLYLVVDAGFVELGAETIANRGPLVLTWKGYDYLEELERKRRRSRPPQ